MKRIISALIIISAFLASCAEEITLTPGISFITPEPEIQEETAIFRIIGQPFSNVDTLKIPVTLGGTAEKGADYELSAEYFTLTKDSLIDSIVVYTKTLGTGKSLSLSLQIPEGFVSGKYTTAEFNLQDKFGLLNFESAQAFITDTTDFAIVVTDTTAKAKALSKDTPVSFSINKEKSTAVEGVDFTLIREENMFIPAGSSFATFSIVPLKTAFSDGKDKIVLSVHADERFDMGFFAEMEVSIIRPELKVLEGSWQMDSIVTDSLYFKNIWGAECTGYTQVPEMNAANSFSISFLGALFTPSFYYGLETYFIGTSVMALGEEMEIIDATGQTKTVQLVALDKTNRYFSVTELSEDTVSYIGIYPYKDEETEAQMMELYVLDHTSKSFMPELETGNRYGTEKPVAAEPGLYFCATFGKR